ncbi:uncharacterized protein M421DRAFT_95179 [Didymella exigua CBS 183.55]|uniref:Transmembrane 9 superfamily member n=1 Tax=Didymella exigua CBS 183.55 TaxID=1150837 RepID=A0A6A5RE85_9PLEO|nr:uncharacterized protein M421DRAFT_95179 [Didymella exigua CBS 183.55]KAF1924846.1 hypothetical protein M421DRAFT_95179 [Didymella exigua CBS 183.55]
MRTSIIASSLLALAQAFYIPGFSYKAYRDGDTIPLLVNKVYSDYSELQYAFTELPFVCPPTGRIRAGRLTSGTSLNLNLGEVLRGDRIVVSDYELIMGVDEEARYLCSRTIDLDGMHRAKELIREGYVAEWIVDNLPGATSFQTTDKSRKYYAAGFKIGDETKLGPGGPVEYLINNHVTLVIRYRNAPGKDGEKGKKVIVGFEVFPRSITVDGRNESGLPANIEGDHEPLVLVPRANSTNSTGDETQPTTLTIPYTYSVYWREDDRLEWQNRWDMYFAAQDDSANVHWLAILNSLVICGLLTAGLSVVLTRTIRSDIGGLQDAAGTKATPKRKTASPKREKSNLLGPLADLDTENLEVDEDDNEDVAAWKLLHGDVFRAPAYSGLLAPLVGSGMQLLYMTFGLLVLGILGVLNPSFRGGYVSVGVGLFVFAGIFSGYFSARLYKTFGGQMWQKNVVITAAFVPGLLFATVFILNLFVWIQASSTALPFGTLIALVLLWLFVQLPLVYVGSWFGFERMGAYTQPIRPNAIPRQIPEQRWFIRSVRRYLLAGLMPFMVIFVELMFVVKSLWVDKTTYYYAFGFTGIVSALLAVTVVEAALVSTYLLLCLENYHWWWHSFAIGSSSSIWVYAYLIYCYFAKLHISGFLSSTLFFVYGFLACAVYALLTGTIGFLAAYTFVRRIYGTIKVD